MEADAKEIRLQKILQEAYDSQVDLQISDTWQAAVMDRIGEMEAIQSATQNILMPQFERLIWRLAPFAAAILLVLCIALHQVDLTTCGDIIQLIAHEFDGLYEWPL